MVATQSRPAPLLSSLPDAVAEAHKPPKHDSCCPAGGESHSQLDPAAAHSAYARLLEASDLPDAQPGILALITSALEAVVEHNEAAAAAAAMTTTTSGAFGDGAATGSPPPAAAGDRLSAFHGLRPPPISIEDYVTRIFKYAKCSPACFVHAFAYLDRLARRDPGCYQPTPLSVHRLFLTAVMLAAKFTDDHYYTNGFYAKVGGLSVRELNALELLMLKQLDFRLFVSAELFHSYLLGLLAGRFRLGGSAFVGGGGGSEDVTDEGAAVASAAAPRLLPHPGRKRRSHSGAGVLDAHRARPHSASAAASGLMDAVPVSPPLEES